MENKVVAHYLDGRVVKGASFDVALDRPVCHIVTRDQGTVMVSLSDLKALFFVKDLQGDPSHHDQHALSPADPRARGAKQLDIRFKDGERLVGLASAYHPTRPFFFVVPVDTRSNNVRILVNRAAAASVVFS